MGRHGGGGRDLVAGQALEAEGLTQDLGRMGIYWGWVH